MSPFFTLYKTKYILCVNVYELSMSINIVQWSLHKTRKRSSLKRSQGSFTLSKVKRNPWHSPLAWLVQPQLGSVTWCWFPSIAPLKKHTREVGVAHILWPAHKWSKQLLPSVAIISQTRRHCWTSRQLKKKKKKNHSTKAKLFSVLVWSIALSMSSCWLCKLDSELTSLPRTWTTTWPSCLLVLLFNLRINNLEINQSFV